MSPRGNFLDLLRTLEEGGFVEHREAKDLRPLRSLIRSGIAAQGRYPHDAEVSAALAFFGLWRAGIADRFDVSVSLVEDEVTIEDAEFRVRLRFETAEARLLELRAPVDVAALWKTLVAAEDADLDEELREARYHERGCRCEHCVSRAVDAAESARDADLDR